MTQLGRDLTELLQDLERRHAGVIGTGHPLALEQQRAEDDQQHECGRVVGLARADERALLDDADGHARAERDRQALHPRDDRDGQPVEQDQWRHAAAGRQRRDGRLEEHGDPGADAGKHPNDRGQAADRHTEQPRAVGVLRGRADRDARTGVSQERSQAGADDNGGDHDGEVVTGEDDPADRQLEA